MNFDYYVPICYYHSSEKPTNSAPIINSYRGETIVLGVFLSIFIVVIIAVFVVLFLRRSRSSDPMTIGYKSHKDDATTSGPVAINKAVDEAKNGIDNPMYGP